MNDTDTTTEDRSASGHDMNDEDQAAEREAMINDLHDNAPEEPVDFDPDLADGHAGDAPEFQDDPVFEHGDLEDPCTMVGPEDPDWNEIMEELCDTEVSSDGPHENPAYDEGDSGTADEDAAYAEEAAEVVAVPNPGSNAAEEVAEVTVVAQPVETLPETGAEVALAGVGIVLALGGAALLQVARRLATR